MRVPPYLDYLTTMFALCVREAAPVYCENGFLYGGGRQGRSPRIVLPLSTDGARVDLFFGIQLNFADDGSPLEPAWFRTPEFREDLLGDPHWRGPDGAWTGTHWRKLA